MDIIYKNQTITADHLTGCFIRGRYVEPNGTGPNGTGYFNKILLFVLKKLPSDKYQLIASKYHDIMYTIGGNQSDKDIADKLMLSIAIALVKKHHSIFSPLRYWYMLQMRRNYRAVQLLGDDAFNFEYTEPVSLITLSEYNSLKPQ